MSRIRCAVRSVLALVVAAPLAATMGCGDVSSITATAGAPGIGIGVGGGPTDGVRPAVLVGRWSRVTYYRDGAGALHSSETRWEFLASGSASRTIVTTNITYDLQDVERRDGRWTATASEISVTFAPPAAGSTRMRWALDRAHSPAVLLLDGVPFQRIA